MKKDRIASIIVSGGYSSRMHSFKPFLRFGKYTVVETVINTLENTGVHEIILVTGHRGEEIIKKLKDKGISYILNENYHKGMYSSVVKGVEALDDSITGFFIYPVDIPLVKSHTLQLLQNQFLQTQKGILYPTFSGERGHPPLLDSKYREIIINYTGEGGLRRLLQEYEDDAMDISVGDEIILMDMNIKEDYEKLLRYFHTGAPNRKECYEILNIHKIPVNIVKHSTEVARVSLEILAILKETGYYLNQPALEAAALLHDIVKGEKNHAQKGAKLLKEMGYEEVGYILSSHTDIEVDEEGKITENEILYLADKLVKEDKIIPLWRVR